MPSLVLLVSRWVMALGLGFGMTFGVGMFSKGNLSELFCIARDRDALVADHMFAHNEVHWDMNFIRLVHDWEVDFVSSLFNALYSIRMGWGDEDKFCWIPSKKTIF
jgi:hypothetical protein